MRFSEKKVAMGSNSLWRIIHISWHLCSFTRYMYIFDFNMHYHSTWYVCISKLILELSFRFNFNPLCTCLDSEIEIIEYKVKCDLLKSKSHFTLSKRAKGHVLWVMISNCLVFSSISFQKKKKMQTHPTIFVFKNYC